MLPARPERDELSSNCGRYSLTGMSAAAVRTEQTPYQQPLEKVVTGLGADLRTGLTQAEARSRLERYGRNELTAKKPVPAWRKFLAQFQDPLVLLLLVATMISAALWLYERDSALPYEAIASSPLSYSTPSSVMCRKRALNLQSPRCDTYRRRTRR